MAKMTLREYANKWLKDKGMTSAQAKKDAKKYKSIAAAKKAGSLYYTDKNGKVMLAVYAEDLKRGTSPKPKLRPDSTKDKPKVSTKRVSVETKKAETGDKEAKAKGGMTVKELTTMARKAINTAGISSEKKERIKSLMEEIKNETGDVGKTVPGRALVQAVRNTLSGEGPTNPTAIVRQAREKRKMDREVTKDSDKNPDKYRGMSKGGMTKRGGYSKGGMADRRNSGMFYSSASPRGYN